jgi:phosphatidylglycerophosphate synthase
MRHAANLVSISRIFFSVLLVPFLANRPVFLVIYLYCGFSDVLDGYIARKTGTQSLTGARLDSLADFVMYAAVVIILFIRAEAVLTKFLPLLVALLLAKLANIAVAWLKHGVFVIGLHTWGNKLTGFLAYLGPILLLFVQPEKFILPVLFVAVLSALEESAIHLFSEDLDLNRKSLFFR